MKKPGPKFNSESNYYPILLCPRCGGDYLHHREVEVFERREDEDQGLHILVEGKMVKVDTVLLGNPSSRRNGLRVWFYCENCQCLPIMVFEQHKGQTFVHMELSIGGEDAEFPFSS